MSEEVRTITVKGIELREDQGDGFAPHARG